MSKLFDRLKSFLQDARGVSAIEFGFIGPILVAVVIGTTDAGLVTYRYYDMDAAVGSGAQYVMRGGSDMSVAQAIVGSGWTTRTQKGAIAVEEFCRCAAKIAQCSATCADGASPQGFTTIRVSDTYHGLFVDKDLAASETIRVR